MATRTLSVSAPGDELTALVAALALAARAGTAVAVDADPLAAIPLPGRRSLADLVEESPTLDDLVPRRPGVAVLPNGGVAASDAREVIDALRRGWPAVVLRSSQPVEGFPQAQVCLALPNRRASGPCIWVRSGLADPGGDGPVVRGPTRRQMAGLLAGRMPGGRWLRSWEAAWEWPWR